MAAQSIAQECVEDGGGVRCFGLEKDDVYSGARGPLFFFSLGYYSVWSYLLENSTFPNVFYLDSLLLRFKSWGIEGKGSAFWHFGHCTPHGIGRLRALAWLPRSTQYLAGLYRNIDMRNAFNNSIETRLCTA